MSAQDLSIRTPASRWRLVAEAPAQAEEALAAIPRPPGWLRLVVRVGASAVLWAAIFAGLR